MIDWLNKFKKKKDLEVEIIDKEDVEKRKETAEQLTPVQIQENAKHYSEDNLWKKVQKFAKIAGQSVIYAVLILYYTLKKPELPKNVKLTIIGALGYFILPLDIIPDFIPGVGYVDDLSVLVAAIFQVAKHIDDEVKNQAKNKLRQFFGDDIDTSEIDDKF